MASEQEKYHEGLGEVIKELQEGQRLTGVAKGHIEKEAELRAEARRKYDEFLSALGAVATYHRMQTAPAAAGVVRQAQQARRTFFAVVPVIPKGTLLEQINNKVLTYEERWRDQERIMGEAGATVTHANRVATVYGPVELDPMDAAAERIPQHYDNLVEDNQAIVALLRAQTAIS